MTNYYEIRDRVPCEEIDALTVEAARVWLERNGWTIEETFEAAPGTTWLAYVHASNGYGVTVASSSPKLRDHGQRMVDVVTAGAESVGRRVAVVIAEIRAIADWQKRCAEWVPPKDGETCDCWACAQCRRSAVTCPTCSNKRCPRATDHRNGCSGSNEPGQDGSRYA